MLCKEKNWLAQVKLLFGKEKLADDQFNSWAAFHASFCPSPQHVVDAVALLSLFPKNAHSVALVRHAMNVVNDVVRYLNPDQTPVIVVYQPRFALAKHNSMELAGNPWRDYVVMFGGLHVEMVGLKALGEWLDGNGWVGVLSEAEVATPGTAESFLKVSHLAKARRAHQVTAAALHVLRQSVYDEYKASLPTTEQPLEYDKWCDKMTSEQPQFSFWSKVLKLELLMFELVRALREGNFNSYVESVAAMMPWMFVLDHVNYVQWLSVSLVLMRSRVGLTKMCASPMKSAVIRNMMLLCTWRNYPTFQKTVVLFIITCAFSHQICPLLQIKGGLIIV